MRACCAAPAESTLFESTDPKVQLGQQDGGGVGVGEGGMRGNTPSALGTTVECWGEVGGWGM